MPSSRIESILRSLAELRGPVRVTGALPPARAWIIARTLSRRPPSQTLPASSALVLCQDDENASRLATDIEETARLLGPGPLRVCQLPGWEQSPYSPIAPSLRSRLERAATLAKIAADESPPEIIVTTLAALFQATLPPDLHERLRIRLRVDESVESREALVSRLLKAGYLRVDPVEDPGTFAVRGDIIDVFPPDRNHPLRVELFGDMIEKIREFDPATQRALPASTPLAGCTLSPAREVSSSPETVPLIRERLKRRADDLGIPRSVRDPVLASVLDGVYPEHSEFWAPFAYERSATGWDYLKNPQVIWEDELACRQLWDAFLQEQRRLADELPRSRLILPPVSELFPVDSTLDRAIGEASRLYLDRIELTEAEDEAKPRSRHRVEMEDQSELTQRIRQSLDDLEPSLSLWRQQGFRVLALAPTGSQLDRIRFLLSDRGIAASSSLPPEPARITLAKGAVSEGFRWPAEGLVLLTEDEILGVRHAKTRRRRATRESGSAARDWAGLQALADLSVGDAVVHRDHGLGRYRGLVRLDLSGAPSDFLLLEYANRDKLYLPVYRLNLIQKYIGGSDGVALDRLGTQQFAKTKEKVREEVRKLAINLIELYAERSIREGPRFSGRDAAFSEFEAGFPFEETPDQMKAIDQTLEDMRSGRVMDRLICGDVGYGKTEVAIRAAFRAVTDGRQVAVLVPTTVLAFQHEQSFRARLKDHPLRIESVSRFKSAKEQRRIIEDVASGKVDIVIGTHRLLSRDVRFRDLGLIVVDEEHRFGVEHKERLKTLKVNAHVLTLTATPIPRTLHMSLSGLRDISLISTPPVDRLPIRTYISKYDESLIQRAIEQELGRGGQVFYLYNQVQTIHRAASRIRELVPQAVVAVAHGQMAEGELETTMLRFYRKECNVLVCTTIIESGLDVPNANTIVIDRADTLGLAQLYQIRGRVGRGQQRAYAYLLIPAEGAVTEDARRRLEVIQRFVDLGSGFSVASHDLEIRGGGDLLGPQQSGNIAAVGFELYTELLEEAIRELRGRPASPEESRHEPEIKAPFSAFLGEEYVPEVHQRLSLYRRLSAARDEGELVGIEAELCDRFGPLPREAESLIWLIRVKLLLKRVGVDSLTVGPERASLVPAANSRLDPARAIALVSSQPSRYQLLPDSKFVVQLRAAGFKDLAFALENLFSSLNA